MLFTDKGFGAAAVWRLIFNLALSILMLAVAFQSAGCGGASPWVELSNGRPDTRDASIKTFAVDNAHDALFAGTAGQGVWRCTSPGSTARWVKMTDEPPLDYINCLLYEPAHDTLYAATGAGVFKCPKPARSSGWTSTNAVGGNSALAYDPSAGILYAGTMAGVYACTDPSGNPSWARSEGGIDGSSVGSLCYDNARKLLFAGTDSQGLGIWRLQNGQWTDLDGDASKSSRIGSAASLAYDSSRDILYAGTADGVIGCHGASGEPSWRSVDGRSSGMRRTLVFDPRDNILYASDFAPVKRAEAQRGTQDQGEPWSEPQDGRGVTACSNPDSTPKWTNTGGGLANSAVDTLCFDQVTGTLYASLFQGSAWRYEPPK